MDIQYTIRIKEKHNPPTFKEELGKGVVATVVVTFKGATEEDFKKPLFQKQIFEQSEKFLHDYFEVVFDKCDKKQ